MRGMVLALAIYVGNRCVQVTGAQREGAITTLLFEEGIRLNHVGEQVG
jgi:hypothetical protein